MILLTQPAANSNHFWAMYIHSTL